MVSKTIEIQHGAAHLLQNVEAFKLKQAITMFILVLGPKTR